MTETPDRVQGVSRRRFLLLSLTVAGGAAAAALPATGIVEKVAPAEAEGPDPPPLPWDVRRRMMMRAHDDVVLVGREDE